MASKYKRGQVWTGTGRVTRLEVGKGQRSCHGNATWFDVLLWMDGDKFIPRMKTADITRMIRDNALTPA